MTDNKKIEYILFFSYTVNNSIRKNEPIIESYCWRALPIPSN
jgi:hypothetical protein